MPSGADPLAPDEARWASTEPEPGDTATLEVHLATQQRRCPPMRIMQEITNWIISSKKGMSSRTLVGELSSGGILHRLTQRWSMPPQDGTANNRLADASDQRNTSSLGRNRRALWSYRGLTTTKAYQIAA